MNNLILTLTNVVKSRFFSTSISIFCLFLASAAVQAQSLSLVSSSPAQKSSNVALETTVTFTFNHALDVSSLDPDTLGEYFIVYPMEGITITNKSLTDGNTTIRFEVTHLAETDYVWIFYGLVGESGETLSQMHVVNYTTRPAISDFTVRGQLSFINQPNNPFLWFLDDDNNEQMHKPVRDSETTRLFKNLLPEVSQKIKLAETASDNGAINYANTVLFLLDNMSWLEDQYSDGPFESMSNAGYSTSDGQYIFENVRPGDYYVCALLFELYHYGIDIAGIGCYTVEDDEPVLVTVDNASLIDIDFPIYGFRPDLLSPVDATVAFDIAKPLMTAEFPDARPIIIAAEEIPGGYPDFHKMLHNPIPLIPTGESIIWEVIYFDDAESLVHLATIMEDRLIDIYSFRLTDLPGDEQPPDGVLESVQTIPDNFVSSSAAVLTARNNGLDDLLVGIDPEYAFVEYFYELSGLWFEFPDILDENDNPFWLIETYISSVNPHDHSWVEIEAWHFIDAVTGTFIADVVKHSDDASPFHFLHSDPAHMSAGVPLQSTVSFTFDDVLDIHKLQPENFGTDYMAFPMDKIEIDHMWLSEDQRTVHYDVIHEPDTDYNWFFIGLNSYNGGLLEDVVVTQYTTKPSTTNVTVGGTVRYPDAGQPPPDFGPYGRMAIVLLDRPDIFENDFDGPPPGIVNVGKVLDSSGSYLVENVRPGIYYVAAFFFDLSEGYPNLFGGAFYQDDHGNPATVEVGSSGLSDVDLIIQDTTHGPPEAVDIIAVHSIVKDFIAREDADAEMLMAWGREEFHPSQAPVGKSPGWMFAYFNEGTEMANIVHTTGYNIDSDSFERFPLDSVPEDERPDIALIRPVPDGFISSNQALTAAMDNGLTGVLNNIPEGSRTDARLHYTLSRYYFEFPDILDENTNPFWVVDLNAEVRDQHFELVHKVVAYYFIDALTGDFIADMVETSADQPADVPTATNLYQNYPNPFNPVTTIRWDLGQDNHVTIRVFDLLGREVATLVDGHYAAGEHAIPFDASGVASGVYLYRLESAGVILHQKMTILK